MSSENRDYARACGERLKRVRLALGYRKRPPFARRIHGPLGPEELRSKADSIRKYEEGTLPPPLFLIAIERAIDEPGLMDYIYRDTMAKLTEDMIDRIRFAEIDRDEADE